MITVNLLPPEYRKLESTPLARFIAIVAGAVLIASELGVYGYVHYSELASARTVRKETEAVYKNKKAQADVSISLKNEISAYEARRKAIHTVASQRILWSRKLDEILDILHNKGNKEDYYVWLTGLKVSPPRAGRRGKVTVGGALSFQGFSATNRISKVTNLRLAITGDAFFEDFVPGGISMPGFEEVTWEDGLEPSTAGKFGFDLTLKPLGWRGNTKKKKK